MPTQVAFAYGAAAGTSPPAATVLPGSRDDAGVILAGTGTATTTGTYGTITLGSNPSSIDDPSTPFIIVSFRGTHRPADMQYAMTATNTITITCPNAPGASLAATEAAGIAIVWFMAT